MAAYYDIPIYEDKPHVFEDQLDLANCRSRFNWRKGAGRPKSDISADSGYSSNAAATRDISDIVPFTNSGYRSDDLFRDWVYNDFMHVDHIYQELVSKDHLESGYCSNGLFQELIADPSVLFGPGPSKIAATISRDCSNGTSMNPPEDLEKSASSDTVSWHPITALDDCAVPEPIVRSSSSKHGTALLTRTYQQDDTQESPQRESTIHSESAGQGSFDSILPDYVMCQGELQRESNVRFEPGRPNSISDIQDDIIAQGRDVISDYSGSKLDRSNPANISPVLTDSGYWPSSSDSSTSSRFLDEGPSDSSRDSAYSSMCSTSQGISGRYMGFSRDVPSQIEYKRRLRLLSVPRTRKRFVCENCLSKFSSSASRRLHSTIACPIWSRESRDASPKLGAMAGTLPGPGGKSDLPINVLSNHVDEMRNMKNLSTVKILEGHTPSAVWQARRSRKRDSSPNALRPDSDMLYDVKATEKRDTPSIDWETPLATECESKIHPSPSTEPNSTAASEGKAKHVSIPQTAKDKANAGKAEPDSTIEYQGLGSETNVTVLHEGQERLGEAMSFPTWADDIYSRGESSPSALATSCYNVISAHATGSPPEIEVGSYRYDCGTTDTEQSCEQSDIYDDYDSIFGGDTPHLPEWEPTAATTANIRRQYADCLIFTLLNQVEELWQTPAADETGTAASSQTQGDNASGSRTSHQSRLGKRKLDKISDAYNDGRKRGDDEDDDSQPTRNVRKDRPDGVRPPRFACPFFKQHPDKFRSCVICVLESPSRVKQHIQRKHRRPFYCPKCSSVFKSENERDAHVRESTCHVKPEVEWMCATVEQLGKLSKRSTLKSDRENWYAIFKILFPNDPLPNSPYLDAAVSDEANYIRERFSAAAPAALNEALALHMSEEERNRYGADMARRISSVHSEIFDTVFNELRAMRPQGWPVHAMRRRNQESDTETRQTRSPDSGIGVSLDGALPQESEQNTPPLIHARPLTPVNQTESLMTGSSAYPQGIHTWDDHLTPFSPTSTHPHVAGGTQVPVSVDHRDAQNNYSEIPLLGEAEIGVEHIRPLSENDVVSNFEDGSLLITSFEDYNSPSSFQDQFPFLAE